MDRRSWLWRRKSSETESSGSASSHSERYSEDQEGLRISSVNASPNNARSPEVTSKLNVYDPNGTIKSLNEKLSAALLSINAKEELVQQHVKVAEEAVAGWEKAEVDVAALKKQLEVVLQKNSALEDRTKQLDAALKECVRQVRQSREEQEQKFFETLTKKTKEFENANFELETQIIELQAKLEVKAEAASSIDHQLCLKLEALEKEKSSLQIELLAKTEDLQLRTLERDLSTQAAETASKQHLESIKRLAKLEAECRRLRVASRKSSPFNDHFKPSSSDQKAIASSAGVESLTDSQSDSGERLMALDNEPSCSDSWASALIAELDQFKDERATKRNLTSAAIAIDLMDDFLEMERLAALPEVGRESSSPDMDGDSDLSVTRDGPFRTEIEVMRRQLAKLKQQIARFEAEKMEMDMALSESRNQLKVSCDKLIIADNNLVELQQELSAANGSKHTFDAKSKELESQLESAQLEISELNEQARFLEGNVEKAVSEKLESKFKEMESAAKAEMKALEFQLISAKMEAQLTSAKMEDVEANRKTLSAQLESANAASTKLNERIRLLEEEAARESALSAELTAKCQHLQSQLSLAESEVGQLREKGRSLERIIDEERASLTEFKAQAEAGMDAQLELQELRKKAQLESAHLEVQRLQDMASSSCQEEDKEKLMSEKQEDMHMLRKEKDFVMASSEMFAACQKTINSISQQLKSLSNFENLMLESERCGPSSSSGEY